MPSQICGFNAEGESKWFDGSQLPEGWSLDDPTKEKEAIPGDVQPGDGDGTLKGSDPEPTKKKKKAKANREPEAAE